MLPKDIICMNWYYSIDHEVNDIFLRKGFPSIYANCRPANLCNVKARVKYGAKGISVSSWTVTREHDLQLWQGMFYQVGYGALIGWDHNHDEFDYEINSENVIQQLYRRRNSKTLASSHLKVRHRLKKKDSCLEKYFKYINL